ncbi:hypothetical protein ASF03_20130 [Rhizobium sp. Leaf68]|nr:hypothetical protein ASE62_18395 [Rhizobium sp. Leaf202]KQN80965.1 hypothetical protein ASF03_20130 [Rhizobium sp. Leaf68]
MLLPRTLNLTAKFAGIIIEQRLTQALMHRRMVKMEAQTSPSNCVNLGIAGVAVLSITRHDYRKLEITG